MANQLSSLVTAELAGPADPRAAAMAGALAARYPSAARAVLFYGSFLREANLDGLMLDFYLIVSDYRAAYGKSWLARANRLIPPNVFPFEHQGLIAKYAVLSEADFARLNGRQADNVSVWARFAQPCRIHGPTEMTDRLEIALATAIATFCKRAAGLLNETFSVRELWLAGLGASYKAELRAEDESRAGKLIDSYGGWTAQVTPPALAYAGLENTVDGDVIDLKENAPNTALAWRLRAVQGAFLSVLRLLKGTQTFKGGIDYIAWKIKRHSGVDLEITDWERRHPMLGAPGAAIRYYKLRGQVKKGA